MKDAEGFTSFLQTVFDGELMEKHMRDEHVIMHAEVAIGSSTIMIAENTTNYPSQPAGMFIFVDDADTRYEKALNAGATVVTPMSNQPYGRSGGVKDVYGNTWWVTSVKL